MTESAQKKIFNPETTGNVQEGTKTQMLFDADATQRVELTISQTNRKGKTKKYKVAHVFAPMTDQQFFQHEDKKNFKQKISGTDLLNVRNEDNSLKACEWLWNELATAREGYVERENWKEKTSLLDKVKAIREGLLAVFPVNELEDVDIFDDVNLDEETEEFADELFDDEVQTVVRLDCLFNSTPLTTTHFFNPPSAQDVADYEEIMKKANNLMDGRRGGFRKKNQVSQIAIPSKARDLCKLYDRLIIETEGYKGRVPAHHKREAILEVFARDVDITEKN